jgi:hypothetical protein
MLSVQTSSRGLFSLVDIKVPATNTFVVTFSKAGFVSQSHMIKMRDGDTEKRLPILLAPSN